MKRSGLVFLAMIVCSATPTLAQDATGVRSAIERHYAAIHGNDTQTVFDQHLSDFTWFSDDGRLLLEGNSAERMGTTMDFGTINVYMNHFNAQIYGDVAVATFYLVDTGIMGERDQPFKTSRVTAVWVREGGEWKEAHHHESPLRSGAHPQLSAQGYSSIMGSLTEETKMAAYFILTQTVTDQMAYSQQYIPGVLPFLAKHGAEVLVASFETEALQGEPADGAVVLRFPSEQAVRNFVNDPDYRPLKELRLNITRNANAVLAPEFEWPESED